MIPIEAISAIVRATHMPKESAFELMQDWCFEMGWPDVTDEQLEEFWSERKVIQ